jgi:hypothetical protein
LSVLGFGTGNLKDATMEQLPDRGNGNVTEKGWASDGSG